MRSCVTSVNRYYKREREKKVCIDKRSGVVRLFYQRRTKSVPANLTKDMSFAILSRSMIMIYFQHYFFFFFLNKLCVLQVTRESFASDEPKQNTNNNKIGLLSSCIFAIFINAHIRVLLQIKNKLT